MNKLIAVSVLGGGCYFAIQQIGGWMIYIPALQQISIACLAVLLCFIANKLLSQPLTIAPMLIAPCMSFIALLLINEGEMGLVYGISLLNFLVFTAVVILYKKFLAKASP